MVVGNRNTILGKNLNIIFLDIDGPVIPYGMYFVDDAPSANRVFSPISIGMINKLCEKTSAFVVTNSNHSWQMGKLSNDDLKGDLMRAGLKWNHFHADWRTDFGRHDYAHGKGKAVNEWIARNVSGEVDLLWVGFDDEELKHPWYIKVDFDLGITPANYQTALGRLARPEKGIH